MLTKLKQPIIVPIGRRKYLLKEGYVYGWLGEASRKRIYVPSGFEYDGASVPRGAWTFIGMTPDGLHRAGALVHDFIYKYGGILPSDSYARMINGQWTNSLYQFSRKEADNLFLKMMAQAGVTKIRRTLAYWAVRMFGWSSWEKGK